MKYWFIAGIIIASIALYGILAAPKIEAGEVRSMKEKKETIYLAGGCFWGVEGYFAAVEGVLETEVGYANGKSDKATYEGLKESDHAETVRIVYDAHRVAQEEILLRFFDIIDPTSVNKQGNDVGRQYRTGIYYKDAEVGKTAKAFVESQKKKYNKTVAVEVEPLKHFVPAEKYHQKYLAKNPGGYCHVNLNDAKKDIFGKKKFEKPSNLKEKIGELAYSVTQENATEKPFTSDLLGENRPGIYVDIVSGEALFLSSDKFDAGCGWPSFSKALTTKAVKYLSDESHGMQRIEVRSSHGDSHLGHVFNDGPKDKGGLRYCINGAALRFIPKEDMEKEGYGDYLIFLKP